MNSSGGSKAILSSVMLKLMHMVEIFGGKTSTRSIALASIPNIHVYDRLKLIVLMMMFGVCK